MRFHVQVDKAFYAYTCAKMDCFEHFIYKNLKYLLLQLMVKKETYFFQKGQPSAHKNNTH